MNVVASLSPIVIATAGFIASFLFLYGLKCMSSPATAASGIRIAGVGMVGVVLASLLHAFTGGVDTQPHVLMNLVLAVVALLLGGSIAWWAGRTVKMTAMPQMVAIYNGMGGGAAAAIAVVELFNNNVLNATALGVTCVGGLIGAISCSGSVIAWAKLQGVLRAPLQFRGQQGLNALVMLVALVAGAATVVSIIAGPAILPTSDLIIIFFACALVYGLLMTLPIGGADMPVVISIFNACTGVAVSFEGYVLQQPALMIAGMVVGAAGTLLTWLMAKAMNRSITSVLFRPFGPAKKHTRGILVGVERSCAPADAGVFMRYAQSVIIVPGYGVAAAQAQQKLYDLVKLLITAGVTVKFAIHPVAGRMPGQMDVLLAEAGVPYDMIAQMEDINGEFATADVALVIGANDVVNPAALSDKTSPLYGMPILLAANAKHVYVVKRGQGKGYAGVANPLFYASNCEMVYGDAQAVLIAMIEAIRGLGSAAA